MDIIKGLQVILLLMLLLAMLTWLSQIPDYMDCLNSNIVDDAKCFEIMLFQEPHIKGALELSDACQDGGGADCYTKLGMMVATEKISSK